MTVDICGGETIALVTPGTGTTKVWVNENLVIANATEYWTAMFKLTYRVPSLALVCGLQNITFFANSELTKPFLGTASVPADLYPANPKQAVTFKTATPYSLSVYAKATTRGGVTAVKQMLYQIIDCSSSSVIVKDLPASGW